MHTVTEKTPMEQWMFLGGQYTGINGKGGSLSSYSEGEGKVTHRIDNDGLFSMWVEGHRGVKGTSDECSLKGQLMHRKVNVLFRKLT